MDYIDFALSHPELPWDWHALTHAIITTGATHKVLDYPEAPWDWVYLTRYIEPRYALSRPKLPWDWVRLSCRVPLVDILARRSLWHLWYWKVVTERALFESEQSLIISNAPNAPWDYEPMTESSEFVAQHPYLDWDWDYESVRVLQNDELHLVERYPDVGWDYSSMSRVATVQDLKEYPELDWDWRVLSIRVVEVFTGLTLQDALHNPQWPWAWERISFMVSLQQVIQHPGIPWDWYILTANYGTLATVLQYPDLPWDLLVVATHVDNALAQSLPPHEQARAPIRDSLKVLHTNQPRLFFKVMNAAREDGRDDLAFTMHQVQELEAQGSSRGRKASRRA